MNYSSISYSKHLDLRARCTTVTFDITYNTWYYYKRKKFLKTFNERRSSMKKFARLIGRLPFCGKLAIQPLTFKLYESMTVKERKHNYLKLCALLVIFILCHVSQVRMGFNGWSFNAPIPFKIASALYAIINASVVLTQIYLTYRVSRFFFCSPLPRAKREYALYPPKEVLLMLLVTYGGQIVYQVFYSKFK